jgi:hypothetical protein
MNRDGHGLGFTPQVSLGCIYPEPWTWVADLAFMPRARHDARQMDKINLISLILFVMQLILARMPGHVTIQHEM